VRTAPERARFKIKNRAKESATSVKETVRTASGASDYTHAAAFGLDQGRLPSRDLFRSLALSGRGSR
jgi:hypothetical protein